MVPAMVVTILFIVSLIHCELSPSCHWELSPSLKEHLPLAFPDTEAARQYKKAVEKAAEEKLRAEAHERYRIRLN